MEEPQPLPRIRSGRRSCGDSNSPEFEFWMVGNPSFPQPNLLSADELFSHGVILPLHHLNISNDPPPEADASGSDQLAQPKSESAELSATSKLTSSKRWRDIFRKSDKKTSLPPQSSSGKGDDHSAKEKDSSAKERRREKKNGAGVTGGGGASSAELNINIWPFARSRSAGNGGTRPRAAASSATRKVSSAPCSRSNSRGESKSRKWPNSPGRAGVHLGRSSPVWQVRRSGGAATASSEKAVKKDGNDSRRRVPVAGGSKARALSLNVPMCIDYRQHFSCRSNEISTEGVAGAADGGSAAASAAGEGVRGNNIFNIKSLFSKKVY